MHDQDKYFSPSKPSKITAPLLSRLIDQQPDIQYERESGRDIQVPELYEAIRNNLENILNTRKPCLQVPHYFTELEQSLINYGMPDFANSYYGNHHAQNRLCQDIKSLIQHFEPRLQQIQVTVQKNDQAVERILKLRIEAMLKLIPKPSPAIFESAMNMAKTTFDFTTARHGYE